MPHSTICKYKQDMKRTILLSMALLSLLSCGSTSKKGKAKTQATAATEAEAPKGGEAIVYFTKDITPESLVKIYKALGKSASGKVAVKISTGELGGHNYLKPELIKPLVDSVKGTIVECNTAYEGSRSNTEAHRKTISEHGFDKVASVDIMDEEGSVKIPVKDSSHIKYDLVGSHLGRYDFMVNLAHFKGHAMGGFGGVLKNQSIGVASAAGKAYIHSAGYTQDVAEVWSHVDNQDGFLESMAAAAQAVHEYFKGNIVYINIMNNMSIDCDCDSDPAAPKIKDMGIMASLDPVALDQACLDKVFAIKPVEGNDNTDFVERVKELHGTHTVEYAEKIGLGTRKYTIVSLD